MERKRFYLKSSKKLYLAHLAGKELGEKIKKRSKNLYKKKNKCIFYLLDHLMIAMN